MTILWAGNEDICFLEYAVTDVSTSVVGRPTFARCSFNIGRLSAADATAMEAAHTFSSVTEAWLGFSVMPQGSSFSASPEKRLCGLATSGSLAGIFVGVASGKLKLWTRGSAGTLTEVMVEATGSLPQSTTTAHRIDVHLLDIGSTTGSAEIYRENKLVLTGSGLDFAPAGLSSVNVFRALKGGGGSSAHNLYVNEFIVADEPTLHKYAFTLYPNAAGDSNDWNGAYTAVDEIVNSDVDIISSSVDDQDFLANTPNPTATGAYFVYSLTLHARASTDGAGSNAVKLGLKSGGTVDVDSSHTLTSEYSREIRHMTTNPVTAGQFTQDDVNGHQIALRSATV